MVWKNWNPIFNGIADEQGVEVGSEVWKSGGLHPYSAQGGDHPAYGWRHHHRLELYGLVLIQAILANYGHRRTYYDDAPVREGGSMKGGRPKPGWTPEDPGDQPNGSAVYLTSKGPIAVSGPDVQHFHIGPIIAVADSSGYLIKSQGKLIDASIVAKQLVRYWMKTLAGQVVVPKVQSTTNEWGERGNATIMNALVQAMQRGLIDVEDRTKLLAYVEKHIIPFHEVAPGHTINTHANGLPTPNFQMYNEYFWAIPPMYQLLPAFSKSVRTRMEVIIARGCQWFVDLDEIVPSYGGNIAAFAATPDVLSGVNGKPVPSLKGRLLSSQILKGKTDWSLWNCRAALVATEVLGKKATPLADKILKKWMPKISDPKIKVWLVAPNGEYL